MNPHNMFFNIPDMSGNGGGFMGNPNMQFSMGSQQQNGSMPGGSSIDGQILITNNCSSLRVREPSDSMIVNGHNNKIDIQACVNNAVISGHNNRLSSSSSSNAIIDNLTVVGHNNRIEGLLAKLIAVKGHNNVFINVGCGGSVSD
jgi:hypothetical protein